MKKTAVALVITLTISTNHAFPGSQLIQKDYMQSNHFLDAAATDEYSTHATDKYAVDRQSTDEYAIDEYSSQKENEQNLEEYDQYNCDTAQPQTPSTVTVLLTKVFGFMLMRYITIKEMARTYCHEIKELINKWFSATPKA